MYITDLAFPQLLCPVSGYSWESVLLSDGEARANANGPELVAGSDGGECSGSCENLRGSEILTEIELEGCISNSGNYRNSDLVSCLN